MVAGQLQLRVAGRTWYEIAAGRSALERHAERPAPHRVGLLQVAGGAAEKVAPQRAVHKAQRVQQPRVSTTPPLRRAQHLQQPEAHPVAAVLQSAGDVS